MEFGEKPLPKENYGFWMVRLQQGSLKLGRTIKVNFLLELCKICQKCHLLQLDNRKREEQLDDIQLLAQSGDGC